MADRIGILLECVAHLADSAKELHALALLHHVRSLVRRGVQTRRLPECDLVPRRIGIGAHACGRRGRRTANVRADR